MQPCASRSRSSCPSTRPAAAAARCCAASQIRQTARSSARAAPPRTRWAPAWSAARAPARRGTGIGGSMTDGERILLGHGSGGKLYRDLVKDVFVRAFANPVVERLDDAAALPPQGRIAFTTDSHVVQPLTFPGGDIGRLSVAGTVNDLATAAARPLALAAAFIS